MVDLNPVKVIAASSGQTAPMLPQFSMFGLVGCGGGDYIGQLRGPYTNTVDSLADYPDHAAESGHNGIYRAAADYFNNGGTQLYISEYDLETEVSDAQNGNGTIKEFTVSGVTLQVEVGTLRVLVGSTTLEEGVDYIVDYSNEKVCFKVAPVTGTSNVHFHWKETTVGHIDAALAALSGVTINVVCVAYCFNATLEEELKAHCLSCESLGKPRTCFVNGKYADATNIISTATAIASERVCLQANRCGYYNAGASDPSVDWLEFKDYSVALAGVVCANYPWESMHFKFVKGINWHGQFNSTDLQNLLNAFINVAFDPDYISGNGVVVNQCYTLDSTRAFPWVDEIRFFDYYDQSIKGYLTSPSIIGHLRVDVLGDMLTVKGKLQMIQNSFYQIGAIYNPALLKDRFGVDGVVFPLVDALIADSDGNATDVQLQTISDAEDTRKVITYNSYRKTAGVHEITNYLTAL